MVNEERNPNSKKQGLLLIVAAVALCMATVLLVSCGGKSSSSESQPKVNPPITSSNAKGENYQDVVLQFEKAGFTNVSAEGLEDLITGWLNEENSVKEVSIDGKTKYSTSDTFNPDALVVIRYHSFKSKSSSSAASTSASAASTSAEASSDEAASSSASANSTSTSAQSASSASASAKPAITLTAITAEYGGKTDEGTEISEKTRGLTVTGTYSDGSTKTLKDFTITNPAKLAAGQTTQFVIECEGQTCTLDITCTTQTPEQFKESCAWVDYDTLARYPDDWKGQNIAIYGKVMQVQEGFLSDTYLVQMTQGSYGLWSDQVYVKFSGELSTRVLEDDLVNVYAVGDGLYSYTTVLGAKQTVPSLKAKYIDIA